MWIDLPPMSFVLLVLIIILLFLAIILLAPFRIYLNITKNGPHINGYYKIYWLGITLYKAEISPPSEEEAISAPGKEAAELRREEEETEIPAKGKKHKIKPAPQAPNPKDLIGALPALARVLKNMIKAIKIEAMSCHISFGLNDPADTAIISGYLWSAASSIGILRTNVCIDPYFGGERLDGSLLADIKARLIWVALALAKALKEEKIRRLIIDSARRGTA